MSKRYKKPIHRDTEARTRSGLLSLFWMFVGAVIAVMVGVFLYMSPLFDGFRKEVEVNSPAEVTPLPQAPPKNEYEFYEILPKREFKGGGNGLGEQKAKEQEPMTEAPVENSNEQITIVEENTTYDDPAPEPTPSSDKRYIIKIQNMSDAEEVDKLIADLMMLGVDVAVHRHHDEEKGEILEIISVPMTKGLAYDTHEMLDKNGIKSLVILQK